MKRCASNMRTAAATRGCPSNFDIHRLSVDKAPFCSRGQEDGMRPDAWSIARIDPLTADG